jgi:hypothetical protein
MERVLVRSDAAEAVYRISAPPLGDNSVLYKVDVTENNTQMSEYTLWVRANNAIISFDARAMRNMGDVEQLLEIARRVLARGLEQPEQEEPVALTREDAPEANSAATGGEEETDATETNEDEGQSESEGSLWDLPYYGGGPADMLDIGGFGVQVNFIGLLDFAQAKASDPASKQFYENSAFEGATIFGVLDMTVTNGSGQDLRLPANDAVLVAGSEQVQLSDFQYLGDHSLGKTLLPGVEQHNMIYFALTETSFAGLGDSVDVRLQLHGPTTEDYAPVVADAKYQASLTLTPAP